MAPPTPEPRTRRTHPAVAGMLLVATILSCGAIGFGVGTLVGAAVALGLLGLFVGLPVGLPVGLAFVHQRFRDM